MFVSGLGAMGEMSTDDKKLYVENRLAQIDARTNNLCDCSPGWFGSILGATKNNSGRSIESQKSTYDAIMGSAQNLVGWVVSNILFPEDLRYDLLGDASDRVRRLNALWNNDLKKRAADLAFHSHYIAAETPQSETEREQLAEAIRNDSLEINRLQNLATTSQAKDEIQGKRRDSTGALAKLTLSYHEGLQEAAKSLPDLGEWKETFCKLVSPVYDCNTREWKKGVLAIAGGAIVLLILRPYVAPVLKRL